MTMTGPVCSEDINTSLRTELEIMLKGYQLCQELDCDSRNIIIDCAKPSNRKRNVEPVIYTISFDVPANT